MLLRKHLKSLATPTSFSRGEQYFRAGSVGRITRAGGKFTAKVRGMNPYKVQLTMRGSEATLTCSCPYDFEGVCKHAIALGLAVIDQFGADLPGGKTLPAYRPATLEAALRATTADVQLAFLAELLRHDDELGQRFLAHVAPVAEAPAASPAAATIDSISTEVYEALSDLAFDDDLLSEYADFYEDYLEDEGDGMLTLADGAIDEVLLPQAEAVAEALRGGQLAEALRRWVGVYEGSAAATEPAADDYDLFGYEGYPAHVQERWLHLLAEQGADALLETSTFAAAETEAALGLLTERYREPAAPARPAPLLTLPAHFHELLLHLARDPATAARLRALLTAADVLPTAGLARVLLRVAEVLADDELWLRTSEAFAAQDATLTGQLLDRYRQLGDRTNLLRVLNQRRAQFPNLLNPYILSYIAPAEDEALYLAALEQRCRGTQSLADYRTLQGYWSADRRRAFVDEQVAQGGRADSYLLFGAELLAAENRQAELLPYLRRANWAWQRSIADILALAVRTHPDDCLELVMERTETLLQDSVNGRGRDLYQRIAAWLTVLQTAEELRPPVALFAAHLYTEYTRLNALREELRAARLVRTHLVGKQHKLVISNAEDEEVRALLRDKRASGKQA